MKHPANVNARGWITAPREDITITTHVSVSVATLQHAMHLSSTIQTCVDVSANPMLVIRVSILIMRVAVVNVPSTRPVQTISNLTERLANANAVM